MHQSYSLTTHAHQRMQQRHISPLVLEQVLLYGRKIRARGATFRVVGRKEVAHYAAAGIDLRAAEGVQVLLAGDGVVLTTYRNHDLRVIRPRKRRQSHHH